MAGGEAKALFWWPNSWTVALRDEVLATMCDGGCFSVVATRVFHNIRSAEADGGVADGAACFAYGATDEAG